MWMFPKNRGIPKSSIFNILIGFSIVNHPFWGIPIFGSTHVMLPDLVFFSGYVWLRSDADEDDH